ncbi:3'-5' exonuclease [Akkermansia massiliensis]
MRRGGPGETDQPVQIGIAACPSLEGEPELWTSYIATDKPVLWSASQVHGITTEMLADAPSFPSLWPAIRSRLGDAVVVGHNPATERKFLRRFPGHGFGPWLDTLALGKMCVPGLPDYSLSTLCDSLGLTPPWMRCFPAAGGMTPCTMRWGACSSSGSWCGS